MTSIGCPLYRDLFTTDELFDGVSKSTKRRPTHEGVAKVLFMYYMYGPVYCSYSFGSYGHLVEDYIAGPGADYAIDSIAPKVSLLSTKPDHNNYIRVNAIYSDSYWYLVGPQVSQAVYVHPQRATFDFRYLKPTQYGFETQSYDEAAFEYLSVVCSLKKC